ncbi:DUF1326 domain-containing protein [Limibacillus sp. MBR-115]|jgi:hypothetical protein|uniref:DUF1326 domain-containing protein n=1 Tax=Limibacillus sp. MBR-115 TaxID=3156465 RepID=UPI003395BBFA
MSSTDWALKAVEMATCNCDWGCPCQFNALPTHGDCRAVVTIRIEKGHFGDVSLDGVTFACLFSWPGPIHMGQGQGQLIVEESASPDQRAAIEKIYRGEDTEPGATVFNVFSNVIDKYHETLTKPITFTADIGERTGSVRIPGIVEASGEPIRNPVTGLPHRARVNLPHGFEYDVAEYASGSAKTLSGPIELLWNSSHAHFTQLDWTPAGPRHG